MVGQQRSREHHVPEFEFRCLNMYMRIFTACVALTHVGTLIKTVYLLCYLTTHVTKLVCVCNSYQGLGMELLR
jgi:hypothetical protein